MKLSGHRGSAGDGSTCRTRTASPAAAVGTPVYDARGNTTALGATTLAYDGADRHASTTTRAITVAYTRDATGRIVRPHRRSDHHPKLS